MKVERRHIQVEADWAELPGRRRVGELVVQVTRGKEVYAFTYDPDWLKSGPKFVLDPSLQLYRGPQYPEAHRASFGVFLDSSPDRWGRVLMDRREALQARKAGRATRPLHNVDYLLGVHDPQRLGALRFKIGDGPFLDDDGERAAPPVTSLRALESAALDGTLRPCSGETDVFITPGFRFRVVDDLITNFHLPKSTLLMLVSAFAGFDEVRRLYALALAQRYRFFSYGDSMLLKRRVPA